MERRKIGAIEIRLKRFHEVGYNRFGLFKRFKIIEYSIENTFVLTYS